MKKKKFIKLYLIDENLLTAQGLWQTDNARFMTSSLLSLANNLAEQIHKIKCKHKHDHKIWETHGIWYQYGNCFLEHTNFQDDLLKHK